MSYVFDIKRDATRPSIGFKIQDSSGVAVDLTDATVVLKMTTPGGTVKIDDEACTITDEPGGLVRYDWEVGDTDVQGRYNAELTVTYPDLTTERFPPEGFIRVNVRPAL